MLTDIYSSDIEEWNNSQTRIQTDNGSTVIYQDNSGETMPELFEDVFREPTGGLEFSECF